MEQSSRDLVDARRGIVRVSRSSARHQHNTDTTRTPLHRAGRRRHQPHPNDTLEARYVGRRSVPTGGIHPDEPWTGWFEIQHHFRICAPVEPESAASALFLWAVRHNVGCRRVFWYVYLDRGPTTRDVQWNEGVGSTAAYWGANQSPGEWMGLISTQLGPYRRRSGVRLEVRLSGRLAGQVSWSSVHALWDARHGPVRVSVRRCPTPTANTTATPTPTRAYTTRHLVGGRVVEDGCNGWKSSGMTWTWWFDQRHLGSLAQQSNW